MLKNQLAIKQDLSQNKNAKESSTHVSYVTSDFTVQFWSGKQTLSNLPCSKQVTPPKVTFPPNYVRCLQSLEFNSTVNHTPTGTHPLCFSISIKQKLGLALGTMYVAFSTFLQVETPRTPSLEPHGLWSLPNGTIL